MAASVRACFALPAAGRPPAGPTTDLARAPLQPAAADPAAAGRVSATAAALALVALPVAARARRRGAAHRSRGCCEPRLGLVARRDGPSREVRAARLPADEDVVVVYDPSSRQAGEVLLTVEADNARAPKPVAYRAVKSTDDAALTQLILQRGLSEDAAGRLRRPSSATAVLPSGALIEGLELDPSPVIRELRYRTCLEQPLPEERERLERAYFQPLRTLRERWWWNPMAMSVLARQLSEQSFVVIDDFLPDGLARRLRACNEQLLRGEAMQPGATTGGSSRVGLPHRGDLLKWVGFSGPTEAEQSVRDYAGCIETAVDALRQCASREAPDVAKALQGIRWRSEAMLTCYPAETRARYFRHSDNSSGNGRILTAIVYLNEGWEPGHGGELRLFHAGVENLKVKMEIAPLWNRCLMFWSDDRCPHEVLSACRDRYACTVWYYDAANHDVPLVEIGKQAATGAPSGARAPVPPATAAAAPPPPPAVPVAAPPRPSAPAAVPGAAPQIQRPVLFYNGANEAVTEVVRSLDAAAPGLARMVDLNGPGGAEASPLVGQAGKGQEGVALCRNLGQAFLVTPDGALLTNAESEKWMLGYELEYWKSVSPASPATEARLERSIFRPLAKLRSRAGALAPGQWWVTDEAAKVCGDALGEESFFVLDDFLPQEAVSALIAATDRLRGKMAPGRTDAQVSEKGRGDSILWVSPDSVPELGPHVERLNHLASSLLDHPHPAVQGHLSQVSALSDAQFAIFPGEASSDSRYIRHVDNEDGRNGRLLTCTYYLNEGWQPGDGGEIRIFEPDQKTIKVDVAPICNRLVCFFSDSTVPHEVRRTKTERRAVTIWYLDQAKHLAYHGEG